MSDRPDGEGRPVVVNPRLGIIDPETMVLNRVDAWVLAVLWSARKSFFPLLWFGLIIAGLYALLIQSDAESFMERLNSLDSPGFLASGLLSPFSIAVAALAMRVGIAFAARGAAFPLTLKVGPESYSDKGRFIAFFRLWRDRWHFSGAYQSARWTWQVRNVVLDMLELRGTIWQWWDIAMVVANIVLFIGFFIVFALVSAQIPQ